MHPLAIRFVLTGVVIVLAGVAIAITGAGVGQGALWKGSAVAMMGGGLIVSGIMRHWKRPPE